MRRIQVYVGSAPVITTQILLNNVALDVSSASSITATVVSEGGEGRMCAPIALSGATPGADWLNGVVTIPLTAALTASFAAGYAYIEIAVYIPDPLIWKQPIYIVGPESRVPRSLPEGDALYWYVRTKDGSGVVAGTVKPVLTLRRFDAAEVVVDGSKVAVIDTGLYLYEDSSLEPGDYVLSAVSATPASVSRVEFRVFDPTL